VAPPDRWAAPKRAVSRELLAAAARPELRAWAPAVQPDVAPLAVEPARPGVARRPVAWEPPRGAPAAPEDATATTASPVEAALLAEQPVAASPGSMDEPQVQPVAPTGGAADAIRVARSPVTRPAPEERQVQVAAAVA